MIVQVSTAKRKFIRNVNSHGTISCNHFLCTRQVRQKFSRDLKKTFFFFFKPSVHWVFCLVAAPSPQSLNTYIFIMFSFARYR